MDGRRQPLSWGPRNCNTTTLHYSHSPPLLGTLGCRRWQPTYHSDKIVAQWFLYYRQRGSGFLQPLPATGCYSSLRRLLAAACPKAAAVSPPGSEQQAPCFQGQHPLDLPRGRTSRAASDDFRHGTREARPDQRGSSTGSAQARQVSLMPAERPRPGGAPRRPACSRGCCTSLL